MSLQSVKTEELVRLLETRQAAVFGTGFVAEMFYLALERNGLWDRIRFCVTTSAPGGETFHGRPVVSLGMTRFPIRCFCAQRFMNLSGTACRNPWPGSPAPQYGSIRAFLNCCTGSPYARRP